MRAVCIHDFGGPEVLRYEELPDPPLQDDYILVRVRAASLNRADLGRRSGRYQAAPQFPFVPGLDVAGVVEAIGAGVDPTEFHVGQRVMGFPGRGGYAELVAASPKAFVPLPDSLSFEVGASIPVVFGTSWFALVSFAQLRPGETVLIHAAGSGVGIAGISIARYIGARVITTAGTREKIERAREFGADEGIVYTEEDFAEAVMRLTDGRGVDVVLEQVGGATLTKSIEVLTPRGRLVTVGNTARAPATIDPGQLMRGRMLTGLVLGQTMPITEVQSELRCIADLFAQGKLQTVIDRTFPLSEATEAHRYLESRQNFGKVVLLV